MLPEKEINIIRGKIICNGASREEIDHFLEYVDNLEELLDEGDMEDFYGTEGWRLRMGWL